MPIDIKWSSTLTSWLASDIFFRTSCPIRYTPFSSCSSFSFPFDPILKGKKITIQIVLFMIWSMIYHIKKLWNIFQLISSIIWLPVFPQKINSIFVSFHRMEVFTLHFFQGVVSFICRIHFEMSTEVNNKMSILDLCNRYYVIVLFFVVRSSWRFNRYFQTDVKEHKYMYCL